MNERTTVMTPELTRIRRDLVIAIQGDRRRSAHRRRRRIAGLALAVTLVGGTAAAATNGFFDAAPRWVKDIFGGVDQVDSASAIRVGVIDDHIVYAAPAEEGGFCLYFGPDPRSGPGGLGCVSGHGETGGDQILM